MSVVPDVGNRSNRYAVRGLYSRSEQGAENQGIASTENVFGSRRHVRNRWSSKGKTVITISTLAAEKLKVLITEEKKDGGGLRVFVQGGGCSGFQYGLLIEKDAADVDQVFESNGVKMFVDPISISYLTDAVIDYEGSLIGGGFKINNPKAVSTCGCGSSFTV